MVLTLVSLCSLCWKRLFGLFAAVVACRLVQPKSAWSGQIQSPPTLRNYFSVSHPFLLFLCCATADLPLHFTSFFCGSAHACSHWLRHRQQPGYPVGLISSFRSATLCAASPGSLVEFSRCLSSVGKRISDSPRFGWGWVVASETSKMCTRF